MMYRVYVNGVHGEACDLTAAEAAASAEPCRIDPAVIQYHLSTHTLGRTMLVTDSTASTNNDAKAMGMEYPDGTVFIAETQSGGKGRIGRQWTSPRGGLYMSVILKPSAPPEALPVLSIVAGYAVAAAIQELCGAQLKWPNDVLCGGKKICGILCEMVLPGTTAHQPPPSDTVVQASGASEFSRAGAVNSGSENANVHYHVVPHSPLVVIGIGVNANLDLADLPPEVRETASALRVQLGREVDLNLLAAAILNRLEPFCREFLGSGLAPLAAKINDTLAYRGATVAIRNQTSADQSEIHGILVGIDDSGRAQIEVPGGSIVAVSAGDLSLRPEH